jgi:S-adenosylmethionine:tRNA ribosyltransferase-isomerase
MIAQHPAKKRGCSKLLVADKNNKTITDKVFTDIVDMIDEDTFLVVNSTKVMRARMYAKKPTGGHVEILILEKISENECMAITKGKVKQGNSLLIENDKAVVTKILEDGSRLITFETCSVSEAMEKHGHMPLPPYITRDDEEDDHTRYQTIYSKEEGSVAAPTAGLHFTDEIMEKLKSKGVRVLEVTLNIGIGTFRPVKAEYLEDHDMHTEKYYISEQSASEINRLKSEGKKLMAVGTTAVRTLESATRDGKVQSGYGETNLFIKPGYSFKIIDRLITNFHLPKSTLFVLVSTLAGREFMLKCYEHAKENDYKFFSYGSAMLIR